MRREIKSWILYSVFLLALPLWGTAQHSALMSQYKPLQTYYNPGYTGLRTDLILTAASHVQWIGIEGAPINIAVLADTPFALGKHTIGLGLVVLGQKKGLYTNTEAGVQLAYSIPIRSGRLSMGLQAGLYNSTFDGTKVVIPDDEGLSPNDPSIPLNVVSGKGFDAAAGLFWQHPKFFVGVGALHLTSPRIRLQPVYFLRLPLTMTAVAGYNIQPSSSLITWHPSVFAMTDFNSYRVDVNLDLCYANKFEAGLMFRPINAAGFRMGINLGKTKLGYAFEMPINEMARGNWGSHELVVSYALPITPPKKKLATYKSIRLL